MKKRSKEVGEWGGAAGGLLGSCKTVANILAQRHPWLGPPAPTGQCEAASAQSRSKVSVVVVVVLVVYGS